MVKTKKQAATKSVLEGPVAFNDTRAFSPLDLFRYETYQARAREARLGLRVCQLELDKIKFEFEQRVAQNQRAQVEAAALIREADARLVPLQKEIEGVYGIDLSKITYDDVTGEILEVE